MCSLGIYIGWSAIIYRIGFPLDDAWIHQTYARNLVQTGQWAFIPGQMTSGSTAPLWTLILSIGFILHLSPYIWTFLLGWATLFILAILGEIVVRSQTESYTSRIPWVGIFIALEWHMVWAAGSGMETLILADAFLFITYLIFKEPVQWWLVGIIIGISIWIRPESVTWMGPALMIILLHGDSFLKKYAIY